MDIQSRGPGFESRRLRFMRGCSSAVERECFTNTCRRRIEKRVDMCRRTAQGYSMIEQTATHISSSIVDETSPSLRMKR